MSVDHLVSQIAVFGKEHELWPVVALMQKNLPEHIELIVVEETNAQMPSAAVTLSCDNRFHESLGISREDLFSRCNGSFGLGIDCRGWHGDGSAFFAAPSGILPSIDGVALHHLMLRASLSRGEPEKLAYLLNPFRICARSALDGKFDFPAKSNQSPAAMLGPTIQMDRTQYTRLLRENVAPTIGRLISAAPQSLKRCNREERVQSVHLDNGDEITADMFVDTSGRLSSFVGQRKQAGFQSLSGFLPFDKIIGGNAVSGDVDGHGHTRAVAMDSGLLIETPLREGSVAELLYNSRDLNDDAARKIVGGNAEPSEFNAGFAENPWDGNLIKLGGASARLGPFFSADMRLLHEEAMLLVAHIPVRRQMDAERIAYNCQQRATLEEIRDFALLPFILNRRTHGFWTDIPLASTPESLTLRLNQFKSRGRYIAYDNELFDQQLWIDSLIGFGVIPERYDPLAETISSNEFLSALKNLNADFTDTINRMPEHGAFLRKYQKKLMPGIGT